MGTPSQGALGKLCIDASSIDSNSLPIMILSETLAKKTTFIDTSGIRGTRQHDSTRVVEGPHVCSGQIRCIPTADELEYLLPWIQGSAKSSNNVDPAEAASTRNVAIDRVAKVFTYSGAVVSRATFRATQGGVLELTMDVEANTVSIGNAGTFPSLTFASDDPYVFSGLVATIQAGAEDIMEFELTIDNQPDTGRHMNSTSRASIPFKDRLVTVNTVHPYTSDELGTLYDQAPAGANATFVFTNAGGDVLTFNCGRLQTPEEDPTIPGKDEILLRLNGQARRISTTNDLRITHVLA